MSAVPKKKLTEAEYLAIEEKAEFKSEFYDGVMYPVYGPGSPVGMAGATFPHNRVKENFSIALGVAFRGGPCQSLSSDMKVKVSATGLYFYPDVLVVCGPPALEDPGQGTLLNPTVIIEVLSPSTEQYDRGTKFHHCQLIPTLAEYVLVAQDEPVCDRYARRSDGTWQLTTITGLDGTLAFESVPAAIPLADVYAGIAFPDKPLR